MAILKIAQLGHPILRRQAEPVTRNELESGNLEQLMEDLSETMRDGDGVGIAAPQVHIPKRIIVVEVKSNDKHPDRQPVPLTVMVNPEVISHSEEQEEGWEACLSIPGLKGQVPRWKSLEVIGEDRQGRPMQFEASGFFARVIQHEMDHLDGVVYLDRMPDLSTLTFLPGFHKYWEETKRTGR